MSNFNFAHKINENEVEVLKNLINKKNSKRNGQAITKLKCAIYARKSQEDTRDTSLDTQISYCKELISSCNILEYICTYQEDNVSGMSVDKRTEFLKMIDELKNGNIDVIVCYKWDRFSRKQSDMLKYHELVIKHDGYILAGDSCIVIKDAASLYLQQQLWSMSEYHARTSAERTLATLVNCAKNGKYVAGSTPIGYKRLENGTLSIDIDESIIVTDIFDMLSSGMSLGKIADTLNSKGLTTKTGIPFSKQSIHYIARNVAYCGTLKYNRKDAKKKSSRIVLAEYDEVIVENVIPQLIEIEQFDNVQRILDANLTNVNNVNNHIYLLSGLLRCKNCGKIMIGESNTGGKNRKKRYVYQCPAHKGKNCSTKGINADYIENVVLEILVTTLSKYQMSDFCSDNIASKLAHENAIKTRIERQLQRNNNALNSLVTKSLMPNVKSVTLKAIENQIDEVSMLIEDYNIKLSKCENRISRLTEYEVPVITKDVLLANRELTRQIIRTVIESIEIDDSNDEIYINFKD